MINTRKKTVYEQILEERESKGKNNSASGKKLPRSWMSTPAPSTVGLFYLCESISVSIIYFNILSIYFNLHLFHYIIFDKVIYITALSNLFILFVSVFLQETTFFEF